MGEKVSAELLAMRMDHARGRRAVLVGDVLQDGDRTALVVHVDAEPERWNLPINRGTAILERDLDGRKRYTERRLETLSAMPLVRVGDFVDRSQPAKHRYGVREVQIGDVFADPDDRERGSARRARLAGNRTHEPPVGRVAAPDGAREVGTVNTPRKPTETEILDAIARAPQWLGASTAYLVGYLRMSGAGLLEGMRALGLMLVGMRSRGIVTSTRTDATFPGDIEVIWEIAP